MERRSLSKKVASLTNKIESLKTEQLQLQAVLRDYEEGRIPYKDFLKAGYIAPDGKLVVVKGKEETMEQQIVSSEEEERLTMTHIRVVWCVAALLTLLFWISRKEVLEHLRNE